MYIGIVRESRITLARQIYRQIRQLILSGAIDAGYKLPATRQLSSELSVSRNTVIEAYSQLIAEGYLKTYKGSGTMVADGLFAADIKIPDRPEPAHCHKNIPAEREVIDFRTGVPALDLFPRKEWSSLYREVCNTIPASGLGYCSASGVRELREAIAHYLYKARGLTCRPDHIVITSGSTQGLSLVSHILKDNEKVVMVEDPSHAGLRKVITKTGCLIKGIGVDQDGLRTDMLDTKGRVSFIYTTPSHQYPTGAILPVQRRLALIRYAERNDCYIVEDDYDSEFRYEGQPVSSLCELNADRVIYLGSFSKVLAPSLRIGFMILPPKLLVQVRSLKAYSDVHSDAISQYTLARFIRSGGFERHVWKMKKHYGRNRAAILKELSACFGNGFSVLGHATGLHLVVCFNDLIFTGEIANEILNRGVRVYPVGSGGFYLNEDEAHNNRMVFGYSHLMHNKIAEGIRIIRETLS